MTTTPPKLPPLKITDEGFTYGEDLLGHRICTGARMGLPDYLPEDPAVLLKMRMVAVRMVDQDYAPNGAYFGAVPGLTLYHAESIEEVTLSQKSWWTGVDPPKVARVRMFVKVVDRAAAKAAVREKLPNSTFFR